MECSAVELYRRFCSFVDGEVGFEFFSVILYQISDSELSSGFLIGGGRESEPSFELILLCQPYKCERFGRNEPLTVQCSAAVDETVTYIAGEGRETPAFCRRYNIGMRQVKEPFFTLSQIGEKAGTAGTWLYDLIGDAVPVEHIPEIVCQFKFPAGRIHGLYLYEV